jgi:hypothetical protein
MGRLAKAEHAKLLKIAKSLTPPPHRDIALWRSLSAGLKLHLLNVPALRPKLRNGPRRSLSVIMACDCKNLRWVSSIPSSHYVTSCHAPGYKVPPASCDAT